MERERTVYPPRLRENEHWRAADANAIADTLRDLRSVATIGPEEAEYFAFVNHQLLRITEADTITPGFPRRYGGVFVEERADGTYLDHPLGAGARIGTGALAPPAWEEEGNPAVPVDGTAIVWARLVNGHWLFSFKRRPRWARLTGSLVAAYSGVEIYPTGGTGWDDMPGGLAFGTAQNPLRELNGITGLATGTRVRIEQAYGSGYPQIVVGRTQPGDGAAAHEIQTVYLKRAVGGTFTLTWEGQTTAPLAYNLNAAALEAALEGLSNLTNVSVSGAGTEAGPFVITFLDDFAGHALLEFNGAGLLSDQEWVFSEILGGDVTFHNVTVTNNFTAVNVFVTSILNITNTTVTVVNSIIDIDALTVINILSTVFNVYNLTVTNILTANVINVTTINVTNITITGTVTGDITWSDAVGASLVTQVCPNVLLEAKLGGSGFASTGWADIAGTDAVVTVPVATEAILEAIFDFAWTPDQLESDTVTSIAVGTGGAPLGQFEGRVLIDGVAPDAAVATFAPTSALRSTVSQVYKVSLAVGTPTIKLQAQRASGAGTLSIGPNCKWALLTKTGLRVERFDFEFPNGTLFNGPFCERDPEDCCDEAIDDPGDRTHPVVTTACCPEPMPETLYITFSGGTGAFAALNGLTFPLDYSGTTHWDFNIAQDPDASDWYIDAECTGTPSWNVDVFDLREGAEDGTGNSTVADCEPVSADGTSTGTGVSVDWTISESPP